MTQLRLDVDPPAPPANAALFHPDGRPRRLLWCTDDKAVRSGAKPCPYVGRPVPCGECCFEVLARREPSPAR